MRINKNAKPLSETLRYAWTHPAHSILTLMFMVVKLCLPYSEKYIEWALEQIFLSYLAGEGKFTDISTGFANSLLSVSTNRDSLGTGIN